MNTEQTENSENPEQTYKTENPEQPDKTENPDQIDKTENPEQRDKTENPEQPEQTKKSKKGKKEKIESLCDSCNYNGNMNASDLYICSNCFEASPNLLITQTNVIKEYPLSKKDIESVRYITCKSSWSKKSTAKLYLIKDIIHIAMLKHGGLAYKDVQTKRIEKSEKKRLAKIAEEDIKQRQKQTKTDARRRELDDYLKSIGLPGIRPDSVLCSNYINIDAKRKSKRKIGVTMLEMRFYYEKTDYSDISWKNKKDEIEYSGKWGDDYEEMYRESSKREALKDYVKDMIKQSLLNKTPLSEIDVYKNDDIPDSLKQKIHQILNTQIKKKSFEKKSF